MARKFKENKYITNTILFLGAVSIAGKYLPYLLIIFVPLYVCYRWLKR